MGNYNNLHKYFHSLPIDEYTKGNFKNAKLISHLYDNLTKSLLESAINNRNQDIKNKEKNNGLLLEQESELKQNYNDVDQTIKGLYKEKKKIINKIIAMYPQSKSWEEFCSLFDKNIYTQVNPITIQINSNQYSDEQVKVLNSIFDDVEKIRELQSKIQENSDIRSNYKHQLDSKKNHNSIQSQLNEKTNKISEYYKNEILSYFNLKLESNNSNIIEKDLKIYRNELFSTHLIGQRNINDNLRKKLLRNHNNKYDLFIHIFKNLDNSIHELCVLNNITYKEFKKNEINGLLHQAKEQLIKIINKYINDIIENTFLLELQKLEIISDGKYLIDGLSNNNKDNNRRDSLDEDKKLDKILKIFEKYDIDSNLRYHIQNIRNTEYLQLEVTIDKFTDILNQLYRFMDKNDKNDIYDNYSHHPMIREIHFDFIQEGKQQEEKQLMLFPYTNDEKIRIRTEKLIEITKNPYLLDDNLLYRHKVLIENIIFQNNESIPWKKTAHITRENRLKNHERKIIIVEKFFFNYIIDKENKQRQFSVEEMNFLQSLIYQREYIYK